MELDTKDLIQKEIDGFEKKRIELEKTHGAIKMYTFTEKDDKGEKTGKVFVGYLKQPHILAAARALDLVAAEKYNEAGIMLWDACFLEKESSREVSEIQKYKLGLVPYVGLQIDAVAPDIKKN